MQCIFHACLTFFHFTFSRGTYVDFSNTTRKFRQAFFQFLTIVIACGVIDFTTQLIDAGFNIGLLTGTLDQGRVILVDDNVFGSSQICQFERIKFDSQCFKNGCTTGQNRNVFHHGLTAIAVARSFDSDTGEGTTQTVDHECRKGFAFDIFSNNQQWFALLSNLFEQWNQILDIADLLLEDKHISIFEYSFHCVGIGHKVRG